MRSFPSRERKRPVLLNFSRLSKHATLLPNPRVNVAFFAEHTTLGPKAGMQNT